MSTIVYSFSKGPLEPEAESGNGEVLEITPGSESLKMAWEGSEPEGLPTCQATEGSFSPIILGQKVRVGPGATKTVWVQTPLRPGTDVSILALGELCSDAIGWRLASKGVDAFGAVAVEITNYQPRKVTLPVRTVVAEFRTEEDTNMADWEEWQDHLDKAYKGEVSAAPFLSKFDSSHVDEEAAGAWDEVKGPGQAALRVAPVRAQPINDKLHLIPDYNQYRVSLKTDPDFGEMFKELSAGRVESSAYQLLDGLLYKRSSGSSQARVCVPRELREGLMHAYHSAPWAGHSGYTRMYARIRERLYWPNMTKDIYAFAGACHQCALRKRGTHGRPAPLQEHVIPTRPFQYGHSGPLPVSVPDEYRYIVTFIICLLTKFTEAVPVRSETTEDVARAFVNQLVARGYDDILSSHAREQALGKVGPEVKEGVGARRSARQREAARRKADVSLTEEEEEEEWSEESDHSGEECEEDAGGAGDPELPTLQAQVDFGGGLREEAEGVPAAQAAGSGGVLPVSGEDALVDKTNAATAVNIPRYNLRRRK
ncbi:Retrovirus-related Pol polyprotein from transposon 412 [Frankliniella fusca]|uniref:RNA-directed DNA polymerase n=1 Tax=Frankliniella fusca TaxID=407009 RepID=A0AAE1HLM4_9NEOP|nr:Retrovirus-related Pol polyprotein from transposon 412 [Frankliniella fusca]